MNYLERAKRALQGEQDPEDLGETLSVLFKNALKEIQEAYVPGLLEHLARKHPDQKTEIDVAEDDLERAWAETRQGPAGLDRFTAALRRWRDFFLSACYEHRVRTCQDCEPGKRKACDESWAERYRTRDESDQSDKTPRWGEK
jgi:hypothetical protein